MALEATAVVRAWLPQQFEGNSFKKVNQSLFYYGIDSMKVNVKITPGNTVKTINMADDSRVDDLLNEIDMMPNTVIVMKDDKPIPEDTPLIDGQTLHIIRVSSGG